MHRGKVSSVTLTGVLVLVPDLHPTDPFRCAVVGAIPEEGDRVIVGNCGSQVTPDLVVLGVLS